MDHACAKCGAEVEEGIPFCPQCNAPQIRVQSASTEPATPPMPPGTPDEVQPPAEPLSHAAGHWTPPHDAAPSLPPVPRHRVRIRKLIPGALIFLLLAGIGSVSFPPLLLIFIIAAGGLSVAIYHRLDSNFELKPRNGFKVSAYSALLALLVMSSINVFAFFTPAGREALQTAMKTYSDPQQAEAIKKLLDQINTPGGIGQFLMILLANALMFVAFSGMGGAIGASIFGRRTR